MRLCIYGIFPDATHGAGVAGRRENGLGHVSGASVRSPGRRSPLHRDQGMSFDRFNRSPDCGGFSMGGRVCASCSPAESDVLRRSARALLQAPDEAGDHAGGRFRRLTEGGAPARLDELPTARQFQHGNTLLRRSARDAKAVLAVGPGQPAVAFGDICVDRERCAVTPVGEIPAAARIRSVRAAIASANSIAC